MKTKLLLLMTAISVAGAALAANPLLSPYKTIHQTIPFDQITNIVTGKQIGRAHV